MRKINSILGPVLIILLLIHVISGSFQLYGIIPGGSVLRKALSFALLSVAAVHLLIGAYLTLKTLKALKKSGKSYFKENAEFWIRRISGLAVILFVIYHMTIFSVPQGDYFRLNNFGGLELAAHILLVLSVGVHLVVNIKPLLTALGIAGRKYVRDALIVLSIVLLVCAAAFVFYYFRWNILWRYGA